MASAARRIRPPIDGADPRMNGEFVGVCPGDGGDHDVVLVGVVHDHPASAYRVRRVVRSIDPDVVAVELPPLAVPLYARHAADERTPPSDGGEMSTAIQAASSGTVHGIDGPTVRFLLRLGRSLVVDDVCRSTARSVLASVRTATRHAIACRLAARFPGPAGDRSVFDATVDHGCHRDDDPAVQADHEWAQYRRARAIANVVGPDAAIRLLETAREDHMAGRLSRLRTEGTVVGVVGAGHLEPVTERLARSP